MGRSKARRSGAISRLRRVVGIMVVFAATGCHRHSINDEVRKSMSSEGVRFTAEASIKADKLDTVFLVIKATNRSDGYRTVMTPLGGWNCGSSVGFATGRGKATRIWRPESPRKQSTPGLDEVAVASAAALHFGPGASVYACRAAVSVRAILGDSLPPGLYRAVIGGDAQLRGGYVTPEI